VHEPGPLVATSLRFAAGSRDDDPGRSGLAHILEHMMFCGTQQLRRNGHMKVIQSMGGFVNAKTSADWTKHFHVMPSDLISVLLTLEAERFTQTPTVMTDSALEIEREVVLNERRQTIENVAYGGAVETLVENLYPAGSRYHHLPIGSAADISRVSLADCLRFQVGNYVGPRVNLAVVGGFDPATTAAQVGDFLAVFGAGTAAPSQGTMAGQQATRRVEITSPYRPKVYLGCLLPPAASWDFELARFAALFLGRGNSARLPEQLVRRDTVAVNVAVKTMARQHDKSVGIIELVPADGVSPAQALAALDKAMLSAIDGELGEHDLRRTKAVYRSSWLAEDDTLVGRSDSLSLSMQQTGSVSSYFEHDARITDVRLEDLHRALEWWHQPLHRVELVYTR